MLQHQCGERRCLSPFSPAGVMLEKAGATAVVPEVLEPSLQLAAAVLSQVGCRWGGAGERELRPAGPGGRGARAEASGGQGSAS